MDAWVYRHQRYKLETFKKWFFKAQMLALLLAEADKELQDYD